MSAASGSSATNNLVVNGVATFASSVVLPLGSSVCAGATGTPVFSVSSAGITLQNPITSSSADLAVVNKSYVDLVATGVRTLKDAVRVASTANLPGSFAAGTLTASANGALVIDAVTLALGDRVLLLEQSAAAQNGIYAVSATGGVSAPAVLTRAGDANVSGDMTEGCFAWVTEGATLAGSGWVLTTSSAILNTTPLNFVQVSGIPPLDAGDGIAITAAGSISVRSLADTSSAANTVIVASGGVSVAPALPQLTSAGSAVAALAVPGSGSDAYASVVASDASLPFTLGAVPLATGSMTAGRPLEFGDRATCGAWRLVPVRTGSGAPQLLVQFSDSANWNTVMTFSTT